MIELLPELFDLKWFLPEQFGAYQWANPTAFGLCAALPLFWLWRYIESIFLLRKLEIALKKESLKSDPIAVLRFIPKLVLSLAFLLLVLALARPQITNEKVDQWSEGIDIIIALDISRSMDLTDFRPNRLEAAKDNAIRFVSGRFQDRIGVVIFSGDAIGYVPLTTDYDLLKTMIKEIKFNLIEKSGTAIGTALGIATAHLDKSPAKSKVIILLSDGDSNEGSLDPITASKIAYGMGVKVYTIGVGKEGRIQVGRDNFGNPIYHDNTLDEATLKNIAQITDGYFFRASDNEALNKVFSSIDQYEKSQIKETRYQNTTDFYQIYLFYGILLLLLWFALKNTFLVGAIVD
jgi:Ca-activated chloride channel family protein